MLWKPSLYQFFGGREGEGGGGEASNLVDLLVELFLLTGRHRKGKICT